MQLIADEDIEAAVIARLRADGHGVIAISEEQNAGGEDPSVLARAVAAQLLLLTADRDFGDLIFRNHLLASAPKSNAAATESYYHRPSVCGRRYALCGSLHRD